MKRIVFFCYAAACLHAFAAPEPAKLLDDVISHPGSYSQVCDVISSPADIPYRAYQISDFSGAGFSKSNSLRIQSNRDALIPVIRARLLQVDFSRKAVEPGIDPKPESNYDGEDYGCDPKSLNPLLLNLIVDINAIEALPELLAVEDRLVKQIARAKDTAEAPPPLVNGWGVAEEGSNYDEKESEEKRDRRNRLFNARVAQRDLVMVMQLLMREKKYAPALKTSLEKAYLKGLSAEAAGQGWQKYKETWSNDDSDFIYIEKDASSGMFSKVFHTVTIPYTRESRDEVRAAAAQWVKEHS